MDFNILNEIERVYCEEPTIVQKSFLTVADKITQEHNLEVASNYHDALKNFFILTETIELLQNE